VQNNLLAELQKLNTNAFHDFLLWFPNRPAHTACVRKLCGLCMHSVDPLCPLSGAWMESFFGDSERGGE